MTATDEARAALRDLRDDNPALFETVAAWLAAIRGGDGAAVRSSTAFLLSDGTTARIRTFYDFRSECDLAILWKVESYEGADAVKVFAVRHAP